MIPLEAARLGIKAWGIDYSPVATLAGKTAGRLPATRLGWRAGPAIRLLSAAQDFEHFTESQTAYATWGLCSI